MAKKQHGCKYPEQVEFSKGLGFGDKTEIAKKTNITPAYVCSMTKGTRKMTLPVRKEVKKFVQARQKLKELTQ